MVNFSGTSKMSRFEVDDKRFQPTNMLFKNKMK